ncbi:MAG: hypothetical protein A2Y17_04565 [Clostridiales bacterium GWF2_38_85]|nr:MAG: hypothetical protein A2Y17_04565 [Clostridiales bacterium GWF2_38_85]
MQKNTVTVINRVFHNELRYNSTTVLKYKIEYPEFYSDKLKDYLNNINNFYKYRALAYRKYCETTLYDEAVDQYKVSVESGYPVRAFEAMWVYTITYKAACIISMYSDKYEFFGGAHGTTVRGSQTWNAEKGSQLHLNQLYCCNNNYKKYILNLIYNKAELTPSEYFEDYPKLIVNTFDENSFYCTPMELVVYYQQYDIAPYAGGIREFKLPYDKCILNPSKLCSSINES